MKTHDEHGPAETDNPVNEAIESRYVPNGTPVTDHEREMLVILMEECSEVIHAASKLIRFGKENRPMDGVTNTAHLGYEMGHVQFMIHMMIHNDLATIEHVCDGERHKLKQLAFFMQTNPPGENNAT